MRFSLASSILGSVVLLVAAAATAAEEWTLDKQEDGIDVYTRPVPGSGIKEFMATADVESDVEAIMQVLRNSAGFKDWFPNTSESRLLARDGDVSYQYSVMKTPWPVTNRDNIFRSVATVDEATGVVDITVAAAPDYYPVQEGRVRVQKANGLWKLEPAGSKKTRVTFRMHLDPGGGIPEWLINARVVATPFEALTNLRAEVAD